MENFIRHLRPLSMSPPEATTTSAASELPPSSPPPQFRGGGIKIRYPSQIGRGGKRFFWGVGAPECEEGDRGGRREGTHGSHNGRGWVGWVPEGEGGGFLSVPNMQMPAVTTFFSSLSTELAGAILSVFASLFPLQSICEIK